MRSDESSSPEPADDAAAFAEYCIAVNEARLRLLIWIVLALVLVAGPVEYFLLSGRPQAAAWQRRWMLGVWVTFLFGAIAFHLSGLLRRHADVTCAVVATLDMGIAAAGLAQIGGLETLYAGIAVVTPMMAVFFLMPLRRRLWVAALTPLTFFTVFFAIRPDALRYPFVAVPIFHATLSVCLAIVFGELNYRLTSEHHAQRTRLAGEAARLDGAVRSRTAEVMELARNLASLEETERTRIARELHDELGQELTGARLEAGAVAAAARSAVGVDAPLARRATAIEARIAVAQQRVKDAVFSLRPPALDDFDLATALRMLTERYCQPDGLTVEYENALGATPLTDTQATTIFRLLQEALTNVTRHASAQLARVRLASADGRVVLIVEDDGRGLGAKGGLGFGLRGGRERLRLVGGSLALEPRPEGGTIFRATFPITGIRSA